MIGRSALISVVLLFGLGCSARSSEKNRNSLILSGLQNIARNSAGSLKENFSSLSVSVSERNLQSQGLRDAQSQIPELFVHIRYADTSNFTGKPLYVGLNKCYLHPLALKKLEKAADLLARAYPHLRLLVWDCARPMHIQKLLWERAPVPKSEKWKYLSNPNRGSLHNYGLAVDVTLADAGGRPLDMGTDYDHFGAEAQPVMEDILLQSGKLSDTVLANRRLLRRIMQAAGFSAIPHEWWHFNAVSRTTAETHYTLLP